MDGTSDQAASNWGNVYVPGRSEQRAAGALQLRSGPPHHADGALRHAVCEGRQADGLGVLLGPVRPALHADVQQRRQRRQPRRQRPGLHPDRRPIRSTVHAAATYDDFLGFIKGDECLAEYIGQIIPRNACRAPWTNTLDGARSPSSSRTSAYKTEITLDVLNLINLFDARRGCSSTCRSASARCMRRSRRRQHDRTATRRSRATTSRRSWRRRSAVPARRPPLALADPARRADTVSRRIAESVVPAGSPDGARTTTDSVEACHPVVTSPNH